MTAADLNTVFLRLEGPLQAWGDNSKFVIRRTMDAPTKSGVLGLICCAMGLSRQDARAELTRLNELAMAVRIDRPGRLWQDFHTVGAGTGLRTAKGRLKTGTQGTLVTRRYYLCDASFLVALQGAPAAIADVHRALKSPQRPIFLGRKSCPPCVPVVAGNDSDTARFDNLNQALASRPWQPRLQREQRPDVLHCLVEWRSGDSQPVAPDAAEVWYDTPFSFDPPVHHPRLVTRETLAVGADAPVGVAPRPAQQSTPRPPSLRADYKNKAYDKAKEDRFWSDSDLCVFCKLYATTVQHVTYRRAGGGEALDDLRALCRLCHDAVTMIEYGQGMGLDRINPEDPRWRDEILAKRAEIIEYRSLETRRRRLRPEEVE